MDNYDFMACTLLEPHFEMYHKMGITIDKTTGSCLRHQQGVKIKCSGLLKSD
jgi:hypothetical protein